MAALLIVDDEPSARSTLALLLRHRGHQVAEADGVTAAMKRLSEDAFDVIITDLRMPDGDGLDVLRAAKTHTPDSEVILLTAFAGWESAKEAIRLGALDYFEKGNEPDELYHRIDKALAERSLRRENENLRAQLRERYGSRASSTNRPPEGVFDLVGAWLPRATLLIQANRHGQGVHARAPPRSPARARPSCGNCGAVQSVLEFRASRHLRCSFTRVARKPAFRGANGGTCSWTRSARCRRAIQLRRVLQ